MKRPIVLAFALLAALAVPAAAEDRPLGEFTRVHAEGLFRVEIARGDERSVELSGAQMDHVSMRVRNGALRIWQNDQNWVRDRDRRLMDAVVRIRMPTLTELQVTRGAQAEVDLGRVDAIEVEASTFGVATLTGHCERLEATGSVDAQINAQGLSCDAVEAEAATRARVRVHATEAVTANARWAGEVEITGEPRRRSSHTESAGKVTFVDPPQS
jgi:hypothetical protein